MKTWTGKLAFYFLASIFAAISTPAAVLYVNLNSSNPTTPFGGWSTAARTIQDAVNAANPGDTVLVTNGVYNTGQTAMSGFNRVAVLTAIGLQSVNGPAVTVIQGYQVPKTINDSSSVRCVYLASGASISGFTLTNGSTTFSGYGGGIYCQSGNAIISNCVIIGNSCTSQGAGGYQGAYNNCLISNNTGGSSCYGGGVASGYLTNCVLTGNFAWYGGGAANPFSVVNCTVVNNRSSSGGGGIMFNPTPGLAGLCRNSIIYFNSAGNGNTVTYGSNAFNYAYCSVSNSCSPDFPYSTCITNLPGLVDIVHGDYHLQIGSPCIDTGDNSFASGGFDADGNPRIVGGTIDMGAYENQYTGTAHFVSLAGKNPTPPYTNWVMAATNIQDAIDAANVGEPVIVSNGVYRTGGSVVYGTQTNRVVINKPILVTSLNGPTATLIVGDRFGGAPNVMRCVYLTNYATLTGFTLTNGAATGTGDKYQNQSGGGAWCESTNALLNNCILTLNNAPAFGGGAYSGTLINCSVSANSAMYGGGTAFSLLGSCVLSNNSATFSGGGALGGFLNGCIIYTNRATSTTSGTGGGVSSNVVMNSVFTGNWAIKGGGGAFYSSLTNCILIGNATTNGYGGGANVGTLTGCLLTNNTAGSGGGTCSNILYGCTLINNAAGNNGGGACYGNLVNCLISDNIAGNGGGSYNANTTNSTYVFNYSGNSHSGACAGGICDSCFITNNSSGIYSNTAYNCLLSSNIFGASYGSTLNGCRITVNTGGSQFDVLNNCFLTGNHGNAAYSSILNNCTVVFNYNIGVDFCYVTNSIVYYNAGGNYMFSPGPGGLGLSYCCITPLPPGPGNFTNAPLFLDTTLHLQSNSPCIDAAYGPAVTGTLDVDGRPRTVNGATDIGASEFQGTATESFIAWLYKYHLPDDGSADYADSDGTGMNNWQKWIAGLNPTNPASVLQMLRLSNNIAGPTITWQSVTGITYFVQSSTNLAGQPGFYSIQSNIVGQAGTTSYTDPAATNGWPFFYRVGVQ